MVSWSTSNFTGIHTGPNPNISDSVNKKNPGKQKRREERRVKSTKRGKAINRLVAHILLKSQL